MMAVAVAVSFFLSFCFTFFFFSDLFSYFLLLFLLLLNYVNADPCSSKCSYDIIPLSILLCSRKMDGAIYIRSFVISFTIIVLCPRWRQAKTHNEAKHKVLQTLLKIEGLQKHRKKSIFDNSGISPHKVLVLKLKLINWTGGHFSNRADYMLVTVQWAVLLPGPESLPLYLQYCAVWGLYGYQVVLLRVSLSHWCVRVWQRTF